MKSAWRVPELKVVTAGRAPLLPDPSDPRVEVWRNHDGSVCAYGHTIDEANWLHLPGVASFQFGDASHEVVAVAEGRCVPAEVADAYQRSALPMAVYTLGLEVLHASAVVAPGGVAAFCAVSETGKSTLAGALGLRGFPLWADDAVAIDVAELPARALRLPFDLRLRPGAEAHFGVEAARRLAASPRNVDSAAEAPALLALFVLDRQPPGVCHAPTAVRLTPPQAFTALLPHAYCFRLAAAERTRRMVENYLDLTSRVPVFRLQFPTGLERLAETVDVVEVTLAESLGKLAVG
jgi:hypothetical protein